MTSTRASKDSPQTALLTPTGADSQPYGRRGAATPRGDPAMGSPPPNNAAPPPPKRAPTPGKAPALQKSEMLMATLFETALQLLYYKIQFGRVKPPGSHGKKAHATAELRETLEMSDYFKGRVPSADTIDK